MVAIQTLRSYGLTYEEIAAEVGCTRRQVQRACQNRQNEDYRRPGPRGALSPNQIDELENFVRSSPMGRSMSFLELSMNDAFAHWGVSEHVIRRSLRTRGYRRCVSQLKPSLGEVNRRKRLLFAQTHSNWTYEDWRKVLWTDESWVSGGRHTRTWVTRRVNVLSNSCDSILTLRLRLMKFLTRGVLHLVISEEIAGWCGAASTARTKVLFYFGNQAGAV